MIEIAYFVLGITTAVLSGLFIALGYKKGRIEPPKQTELNI